MNLILLKKNEIVEGLDRSGEIVTKVKVNRVIKTKSKTSIIWLEVPHEFINTIRAIRLKIIDD